MTYRERIADWISGGALSRARAERNSFALLAVSKERSEARSFILGDKLRQIAAMETASANGTVRRMAKAAREALK
ncbi:hypothetical protein [Oceaniglobus trochenteri]|uniref:hypothetical protein n=1 Tax=Oceaniglobus trochenteri TaxID=2763260 RepID=UPI001CFFAA06|nr:hypothetical protein [Oceaniglobus trochenteri]